MPRSALAPLTLTGQPQVLTLPSQLQGLQVRLGNESDLTLTWQWGEKSGILYPSEVDVLKPDPTAAPQITLVPSQILPPTAAVTRTLLAELAFEPDGFPGDYPQQMSRIATVISQASPFDSIPFTPSSNNSKVVTPPLGTHALAIHSPVAPVQVSSYISQVKVTGVQTGSIYKFLSGPVALNGYWIVPIDTGQDQSYTVLLTTGASSGSGTFFLSAVADIQSVVVQTNPGDPLQYTAVGSLPAGWQAPSAAPGTPVPPPLRIAVNIAAGATVVVVANQAAFTYVQHDLTLGVETAASLLPEITALAPSGGSGSSYHAFEFANLPTHPWRPRGAQFTKGDGLALNNQDSVAHTVRGSTSYSLL